MASREEFITKMWPFAVQEGARIGVDPRIIIAQAALESGYGRSAPGNNFFGIKSHGKPGGNVLPTSEVVNGKTVRENASFRAYPGMAESVRGYADFIEQNPRYTDFRAAEGLDAEAQALQASGYATDPLYGAKVRRIAGGIDPNAYGGMGQQPPVPDWAAQFKNVTPEAPADAITEMVAQRGGQGQMPPEVTVRPEAQGSQQGPPGPEQGYSQMVGRPVFHGGGGNYYFDDPMSGRSMPVNSNPQIAALIRAIQGGGNAA